MASLPSGAGALVGKRLGQYEMLALLALVAGPPRSTWRGWGTAGLEKYVVVKCLHDHLAYDRVRPDVPRRGPAGRPARPPNIVQTLGLGEQDGRYYLVMEYVVGMSLALMARRAVERVPRGYIPVPLVLRGIAVQACDGLHYAHELQSGGRPLNLVHRDISPQNLVVTFEGVVKVVDFGIAKAEERETATRSGTIKGKFAYMSPEQCQARDIDRRTDVFALGVVLHELLTGRRLAARLGVRHLPGHPRVRKVLAPSAQNHELDPALDPLLLKALAKDPAQRYPVVRGLRRGPHQLPAHPRQVGPGRRYLPVHRPVLRPRARRPGRAHARAARGRTTAAAGWDDEDGGSDSAMVSEVQELSQFEVIDELDGSTLRRRGGSASARTTATRTPAARRGRRVDPGSR
ncbi:MAG: serine/threonine protein kinase [Kofleriaceae bacterium]|nr:serine/threonine protein kinase [Kofleriaceae bacterium]